MTPIHGIVVATDFSPGAAAAVDRAVSAPPPARLDVPHQHFALGLMRCLLHHQNRAQGLAQRTKPGDLLAAKTTPRT